MEREYGLYIHIPFCKSKCRYCDFYSRPGSPAVPEEYIRALLRDFALFAPKEEDGDPLPPASVYFGGGTPSLLGEGQLKALLDAVRPAAGAEVTLEANPESVDAKKLAGWRKAGVNRISLGVQTARDESLRRLGRLHTQRDAARALALAREAGFQNISGDIMLALPGYSREEFNETLELLKDGGASHVSAYMLKLEPGTPFGDAPPAGLPGEEEAAELYAYAVQRLEEEGYARYEISNFARPGFASRHNLLYWNLGQWMGLGPAAHSCLGGRRFSFAPHLEDYLAAPPPKHVEGGITADDYIMMQLRLAEGLSEKKLQARFGKTLSARQQALVKQLCSGGLATRKDGTLRLTTGGMLVQNAILARLLEGE